MPTENFERMPVERRRHLVRTAAAEFAAAGYDRASLNRIIQACGLSKSSFYHYVSSKEQLFGLVVADLSGSLISQVEIPSPDEFVEGGFWPTVDQLFDRLMVTLQTDEAYAALGRMFYLTDVPDDADNAVGRALASVESWVQQVLDAGRNAGSVRTDLPVGLQAQLVFAVLRALDEWSVSQLDSVPPDELPGVIAAQKGILRRMLEPAP
jgi:AcrR family transcriptional regulator